MMTNRARKFWSGAKNYGVTAFYWNALRTTAAKEKDAKEAVNMAIQRCISEGILKDFLEKNSPEVGEYVVQGNHKRRIC